MRPIGTNQHGHLVGVVLQIIGTATVVVIVLGIMFGWRGGSPATTPAPTIARTVTTTASGSHLTRSEQNAVRAAKSYLEVAAFSRSGLIKQLKYEGFTDAEAMLAVDYITVDWNEQAALSAESYLEISAFSRSGLIKQLEYEGFTQSQATYGVDRAGL